MQPLTYETQRDTLRCRCCRDDGDLRWERFLSAKAQKKVFQNFSIGHSHNRFLAAVAIVVIDLVHPDARRLLPTLFETVRLSGVTWAFHVARALEPGNGLSVRRAVRLGRQTRVRLEALITCLSFHIWLKLNRSEFMLQIKFTSWLKFCYILASY